jgi:hypothetical protein
MNKKIGKQAWVTPKLENIEMINTQTGPTCGQSGQSTGSKRMSGVELQGCAQGS